MKRKLCPQCKIASMYIKNKNGDRLLVYVTSEGNVVCKNPHDSTEGFDMTEIYCLGCSWHGIPSKMVRF